MPRWRKVPGFEGLYAVSDEGDVWSFYSSKKLKGRRIPDGHLQVVLYRDKKTHPRSIHSLVLEAFVGPRLDGEQGCHNDGNPENNHLDNLRWDSQGNNMRDRVLHGTHHETNKTHCPKGHLLGGSNLSQAHLRRGSRACLTCIRERDRERNRRRRFKIAL